MPTERNLIINLEPWTELDLGVPTAESMPQPKDYSGDRVAWRAALIQARSVVLKPTLDSFYYWLQEPDQEKLLAEINHLHNQGLSLTLVANLK
jgi:hypothetical protein